MGAAANQLHSPSGLFISDDGFVYIADTGNNRVVKWGPGVSSGRVVAGNGIAGSHSDLLNDVDLFIFDYHHRLLRSPFLCGVERVISE